MDFSEPHVRWVMTWAVIALCAIVAIYYFVVRKLGKSAKEKDPQPAAKS
jgi:cytochrome oxidase assembly protein ShyY1